MSFINNINKTSTDYSILGFNQVITTEDTSSNIIKKLSFPSGYNKETECCFNVYFNNAVASDAPTNENTTLDVGNFKFQVGTDTTDRADIYSYQPSGTDALGSINALPRHKIYNSSHTYYREHYVDSNVILPVRYDGTQFVILGNPLVGSSNSDTYGNYRIYADGYIKQPKTLSSRQSFHKFHKNKKTRISV
jgi:hypothetical protein